ncbi:MAG: sigma-70 family RNA polymerase sigma factor [Planctomycetota bacterium]
MRWRTTQPSLLSRVRDPDDHAAWSEFDDRYGELIVRFCRIRGLQQSDAEDIRQVVLMSLSSALRGFQYSPARGRFRSYLGRVVRNAISRHFGRPGVPLCALDTNGGLEPGEPDDDGQWEQEWVHHHLRRAMVTIRRSYDPRSVEVFDRLLAGTTTQQVAREMQMSEQAVHKVKQRIRNRLRALVERQVEEEDQPLGG